MEPKGSEDKDKAPEPEQVENRAVISPDAPDDAVEGEAGDGLNQETGDGTND